MGKLINTARSGRRTTAAGALRSGRISGHSIALEVRDVSNDYVRLTERIAEVESVLNVFQEFGHKLRYAENLATEILEQTPIRLHDPVYERLLRRGASAVLNGTEWLTSAEVDALAPGASQRSNAHARANRMLAERRVFAIEHGGRKRYPRYAFDALGTPYPVVREVLLAFGDAAPLRVASWFESASVALDGRRPRELVDSDPAAVVRAAQEHVQGPVHG